MNSSYICVGTCSKRYEVRLVNGSTPNEGRLEICYSGYWHAFCGSISVGFATAVCKHLRFTSNCMCAISFGLVN